MEALRKVATVLSLTGGGIYLASIVTDLILGLSRGWVLGAMAVCGLLGFVVGVADARELTPWSRSERRDAVLGWGVVLALIAVIAAVALVSATVDA